MNPLARSFRLLAILCLLSGCLIPGLGFTMPARAAEDPVYSGPQPGERATPFRVLAVAGGGAGEGGAGEERDPIAEAAGRPVALVFLHGLERSMVPLLRAIDEYGAERRDQLRTEVVFLAADRIAGEERIRAAAGSLKLASRVGLSLDGAEGPGNYGLNKECLMTIVIARDATVGASFALVQPGIADAARVLEAMARACGDAAAPAVEDFLERHARRAGGARMDASPGRRGEERRAPSRGRPAVDLAGLDLSTQDGLREAVRALLAEVESLRAELEGLRAEVAVLRGAAPARRPEERGPARPAQAEYPGAVPTDERLQGLLRRFIRPDNDDALVDQLRAEVEAYVKDSPELRRQAVDGWTRILHFGDRYGTSYARKVGQELLEKLQREAR